ncbi:MAG: 50S ribosomal protein L35 [Armatimonadetes bacterium]|nr:50S ribosomal protein L35 [Armatimonadota bacterium]MDE2207145.1 50S ribosomal protein L35 [Armatimonadota bacterium]
MKSKLKTRKTAAKRFTISGSGKIMRGKTGLNHLMRKKDGQRRRHLLGDGELHKSDRSRVRLLLGEGA